MLSDGDIGQGPFLATRSASSITDATCRFVILFIETGIPRKGNWGMRNGGAAADLPTSSSLPRPAEEAASKGLQAESRLLTNDKYDKGTDGIGAQIAWGYIGEMSVALLSMVLLSSGTVVMA